MRISFPYSLSSEEVNSFKKLFLNAHKDLEQEFSNVEEIIFVDERRIKIKAERELYDLSLRDLPPRPLTETILQSLNRGDED